MFERDHQKNKPARWQLIGCAAGLLLMLSALAGCSEEKKEVCSDPSEHIVLVPSTSKTDYDVSVAMAPAVSEQVVRRVAESCGRITVGIQDGRPAANLVLHSRTLTPDEKEAYNPGAKTDELVEEGKEFVKADLTAPLDATEATGGSPFLSTMIKIGEEEGAQQWPKGTIVLIGDGLVVQRPLEGGEMLSFGLEPIPKQALNAFATQLKSIEGSCVILIGAGATSKLPEQRLRASRQLLADTVEQAGAEFVATRSPELPEGC
jgi:hypothetical protein